MRTGALMQVHDRSFSAYTKVGLVVLLNWNSAVQLYDGISVPLANVTTSTVNVSPTVMTALPLIRVTGVEELRRNVPAADSQLIEVENAARGFTDPSSPIFRYLMLHDSVTFCPRIGGPATIHVGSGSETSTSCCYS